MMPVVLQARTEEQCVTYEPQDFAAYSLAMSERGLLPPTVPFRIRLPTALVNSPPQLEMIEPEIAAFFGLGSVSGIEYVIARQ